MIPELVNLSRGRPPSPSGRPRALRPSDPPPRATEPAPALEELLEQQLAAEEAVVEDDAPPELSAEEFAAQAYAQFGGDDRPDAAEAYAFGEDSALADAGVDPPLTWSDTAFQSLDPSVSVPLARGLIGSAYAYAQAARQDGWGDLRTPALRTGLEARSVPEWMLDQLLTMSLNGAPISLGGGFPTAVHWRASTAQLVGDLANALRNSMQEAFTHVILAPWLDSGGAERVALWHTRAVADAGGRCLFLATDARREGWVSRLPESARYLCLPSVVDSIGLTGHLSADDCAVALGAALGQMPFRVLHVANSYVGTRMLQNPIDWGSRRVFYALYGVGRDQHGLDAGYWLSAHQLKGVDLFLSDNMAVPSARAEAFGLPVDRFRGIAYPVEASLKYSGLRRSASGPRRVLWASRLDPEKQPALVFEIAKQMPDVEFNMFGTGVLSDGSLPEPPVNVRLRGAFDGWESLPAEPFECFLFTSVGEGLPNVILEAMGSGLPIVASNVGAVGEVLGEDRGWLVGEVSKPEGYIEALRKVLGTPAEANKRARAALLEVTRNRTFAHLQSALKEIGYL